MCICACSCASEYASSDAWLCARSSTCGVWSEEMGFFMLFYRFVFLSFSLFSSSPSYSSCSCCPKSSSHPYPFLIMFFFFYFSFFFPFCPASSMCFFLTVLLFCFLFPPSFCCSVWWFILSCRAWPQPSRPHLWHISTTLDHLDVARVDSERARKDWAAPTLGRTCITNCAANSPVKTLMSQAFT